VYVSFKIMYMLFYVMSTYLPTNCFVVISDVVGVLIFGSRNQHNFPTIHGHICVAEPYGNNILISTSSASAAGS